MLGEAQGRRMTHSEALVMPPGETGRVVRSSASVLIADDVAALRAVLRRVLERDGRFVVVGEAGDGGAAVRSASELQPDLILLDVMMPVMSGVEALQQIRLLSPRSKVLIFTGFGDSPNGWGGDAYLAKGASPGEIIASVETLI